MAYFYSASRNSFYPTHMKQIYINNGTFPDDTVKVSESYFIEFAINSAPIGKCRVAGVDGLPTWVDIPQSTTKQLQQNAERKKKDLMSQASNTIAPLQDAVDLDLVTDEEKAALIEWRKYRVLLNRIDCSTVPDIVWPEQPKE
ncbi:tail fiber assembly protein [Xenorhabdus bovienii]|uniref:Tail fiber assembly protein n=2 Tax=Xenorhabdus bovienii TaxID=40576 RepID=A0AAJ1JAU1_XENBV|nr:tail fiber assembly protein [Xenorhabdus bovienii]MDE1478588.1 tail fiber assembly protein [Xenorhabdus bovienii]MDE9511862.1 tail fiber assembly protein [Xenorhabdus bovienii]MDE9523504.1 tail fiber assembly protein [Xenorhabdus bovienii]